VRSGYLKIRIAVDVKGERILALEVTDEKTGDSKMLKPLVEEASRKAKIAKTIADGAYDTKDNFRPLTRRQGYRARHQGKEEQLRQGGRAYVSQARRPRVPQGPHSLEAESRLRVPMDGGDRHLIPEANIGRVCLSQNDAEHCQRTGGQSKPL